MYICARKRMAVWFRCPSCKRGYCTSAMPRRPRSRIYLHTCIHCRVQEIIEQVKYYTVYASDFYGDAGNLEGVCRYYFRDQRAFRQAKLAYEQRMRVGQREYEAETAKCHAQAQILAEAQLIARRVTESGLMEAEQVARQAWRQTALSPTDDPWKGLDGNWEDVENEHPF
jgi:hypothetical protein